MVGTKLNKRCNMTRHLQMTVPNLMQQGLKLAENVSRTRQEAWDHLPSYQAAETTVITAPATPAHMPSVHVHSATHLVPCLQMLNSLIDRIRTGVAGEMINKTGTEFTQEMDPILKTLSDSVARAVFTGAESATLAERQQAVQREVQKYGRLLVEHVGRTLGKV